MFVHARRGNFAAATYEAIASRMSDARVESRDLGHLFPLEEPEAALSLAHELLRDG